MSRPIIEAREVGFAYRRAPAVLTDVSIEITQGRGVALVGESGAGKTTLLRLLLGLATPTTGRILFDGDTLAPGDRRRMRSFRRDVQTVFQDPYSSLDPRQSVARIVSEPLRSLGLLRDLPRPERRAAAGERVAAALHAVGLPEDAAGRYPHEFSGGQRQRVAIARAIVSEPRVLLADEPVSALDVSTRVRIVDLLAELRETRGLTVVMVSHDLAVVAALCPQVAVLERGRVVEQGDTAAVLGSPRHAYTRRLVRSVPRLPARPA
ncbi:ATP-binding cassette domain-containing protein [Planotetraspora phitsanulokensis]|uniref:Dipeptide/oligopeptide/nickel ABC transporter ATP-binding protein n=1 Tax=Planotetraspora phitsanulokensis TaxID=575192 RepID=A0A8J3UAU2_9ACTN|nr:ATP-binding cassette domain-containing protein [Planotetraspora phitsanulokensis]GII39991.1 dipeptide/oligopeptide/nickel ABC transporter ATP-binding protein [Planotetraspora phitsanulokensis]